VARSNSVARAAKLVNSRGVWLQKTKNLHSPTEDVCNYSSFSYCKNLKINMMQNTRRQFVKNTAALGLGLGLLPCFEGFGQNIDALPRATPESQGFDSEAVLNFLEGIKNSGIEFHSFMLLKGGKVIAEATWQPFMAASKHTLFSLSKSFSSTAIGMLVDEGKLKVTDKVVSFFAEDVPVPVPVNLAAMTVKHLLTMNTGHETDTMPELRKYKDKTWVQSFLAHPVVHSPGSYFLYNTGATYMLSAIVHKVTGQDLMEYLKPRLFDPLGISGYDWEKSPEGLSTAGYGLRLAIEDIAKFGQLYLQKGLWKGKQLLSANWVAEATKRQGPSQNNDSDWGQGYGYQFWRCKPGFYRGDGAFGQFCMVMPEYDMVLAITEESFNMQKSMDLVYENLLPGIRQKPLAEKAKNIAKINNVKVGLSLPIVKGSKASPAMARYSDKIFDIKDNPFGIKRIGFGLFADAGVLRLDFGQGFEKIGFGWEQWKVNPNQRKQPFSTANGSYVPTRVAATATWLAEDTLLIQQKFVDQLSGEKLNCVFKENELSISFLSAAAENNKNNPDRRAPLVGKLV
jgi:CubicO group peptidase (beta-lactamase class C family)